MMLGKYFKKTVFRKEHTADGVVPEAPQGILKKCNACKGAIFTEDVKRNLYICPKCGNYFRVHAYRRIEFLLDDGSFEEWDQGMTAGNPLGFPGYEEKMRALQERTGLTEAVVTGKGRINGMETVIGVCDGRFMMASMGEAVGEKITRAVERATWNTGQPGASRGVVPEASRAEKAVALRMAFGGVAKAWPRKSAAPADLSEGVKRP